MERSQKKIHRKDKLTWPANILTCSSHVLSHVLALNGTSLLAVTCPCKNQAGWPFWCPYRNVVFFSLEPCTGKPTLKSHRSKLGLRSTSSNAITNVCDCKWAMKQHKDVAHLQASSKTRLTKQDHLNQVCLLSTHKLWQFFFGETSSTMDIAPTCCYEKDL